jgi:PhoPQ-activated pathogenicity-related protein
MKLEIAILSSIVVLIIAACPVSSTPLDDYVNAPDPNYGYELIKTYEMTGYTLYILNFTSQKWLDETVSDRPIWWHYLCVTVPDKITKPDAGLLLIDGGSNTDGMPTPTDNFVELTSTFAATTGAIAADLQQIPNAPIIFKKDPSKKKRDEDAIIAWTWKAFLENTSDPNILLRLPMTKASVRAMDAVTEFTAKLGVANIKKFMVAGASKRGWTTWTTAAVDTNRVFAAIPIVMDLLNMNENLRHHRKSLGGWTFAFGDYYTLNITSKMDTPEMFAMQRIIDPYYYLDRFTNTKFALVNSAGDEFFIPDDSDYFWTNFRTATNGSAMVRRLPNAEHSCAGHEISIFFSMRSFFLSVYSNQKLPRMTWTRPNNGTHGVTVLTVDTINGPIPVDVTVYFARTLDNKRRDFRLAIADPKNPDKFIPNPVIWKSDASIIRTEKTPISMVYKAAFARPATGWLGFFFQATFPGPDNTALEISSEVNIIPEWFPFEDCYKETCFGTLV